MKRKEKKELLKALKELRYHLIEYIEGGLPLSGLCSLNIQVFFNGKNFKPLEAFLDEKIANRSTPYLKENPGQAYLFPEGDLPVRLEWLEVEIEKLEACIH